MFLCDKSLERGWREYGTQIIVQGRICVSDMGGIKNKLQNIKQGGMVIKIHECDMGAMETTKREGLSQ